MFFDTCFLCIYERESGPLRNTLILSSMFFFFFFIFISINSGKLCKDLRTKWQLREVRTEGGVRREYSFLQML